MNPQKIAIFGTTGEVAQQIAAEALKRGHSVTAIVRNETELKLKHPNLKVIKGDAKNKEEVQKYAKGNDAVICAVMPSQSNPQEFVEMSRSIMEGTKSAGVSRFISAAHPLGMQTENTQAYYDAFKPLVKAQNEVLNLLKKEKTLNWGYAHSMEPQATDKPGKYLIGNEILFTTSEDESTVPVSEYTSTILDEAEKGELELHGGYEEGEKE